MVIRDNCRGSNDSSPSFDISICYRKEKKSKERQRFIRALLEVQMCRLAAVECSIFNSNGFNHPYVWHANVHV